jgi:hypothetical protein
VIRTTHGVEVRIPLGELESIHEVEAASNVQRTLAPHPYLHREGVNRCAACWRDRTHRSHTDLTVREH